MSRTFRIFIITCILASLALSTLVAPRATYAAGSVTITSPTEGAAVSGTVRISGSYTNAYGLVIFMNAGNGYDVHMEDADGNESGTWYYDWTPTGSYGNVEIRVRASNVDDRYWNWSNIRTVNVTIAAQQPPAAAIISPADGSTASGVTAITVSASDVQGLSSVQVRVDWGTWQTATLSGGNYVYDWDTSGLGNKTHAIEARATDSNGNITKTLTNYVKTGTGTNEAPATKQSDRAMWLWEPSAAQLLESPGARTVLAQFMDDPNVSPHLVTTIYFYADQYDGQNLLTDNPAAYRSFISWAHSRGYYVHALLASGAYLSQAYAYTQHHDKAVALMENVLNYNISSAANEQFDGVNIDIEPYVFTDWQPGPSLQQQYFTMLNKMMLRKAAAGQNLNVGPAIPRWYDIAAGCTSVTWNGATKTCAKHVQDITDYISIMDYRDQVDDGTGQGIIPDAQNEITYANSIGKKVMIGIETDQISASGDPESITFQEEGRTYMEAQLAQVYTYYAASPSFSGIVVHHRDSYRALPTTWTATGTRWAPSVPDTANPGTPASLTANMWDWQRIDLHWARVSDDTEVDYYEVHRSTTNDFTPSTSTLARKSSANFTSDWGLLGGTTYYYKIIAVDVYGKKSAASAQASAATAALPVGMQVMKIASITMTCNANNMSGKIKVVNSAGTALGTIKVVGHWEGAAGRKFSGYTAASGASKGIYQANSESLSKPARVIVMPERLKGNNYYWAYSQDAVHSAQLDCN